MRHNLHKYVILIVVSICLVTTTRPTTHYPETFTESSTPTTTSPLPTSSEYISTSAIPSSVTPTSGFTTPCNEVDGMDAPMYIPDEDVTTNDSRAPGSLRYY